MAAMPLLLPLCFLLALAAWVPKLTAQTVGTPPSAALAPVSSLAAPAQPVGTTPSASSAPANSPAVGGAPNAGVGTSSNATEQAALLALRALWQDPHGRLASWSATTGLAFCSWMGVACTNSSVTGLYLAGSYLSGPLSPAIANLSSLSVLNLAYNNLSGQLPAQLGSLPFLSRLQLSNNSFTGNLPSTLFLSPSLQFLILEYNHLSGELPSTIANLVHLRYLSLSFNYFSGPIPPSIASLTKLSAIYLGFNSFNGTIPSHIGDLHRLGTLDLRNNLLTGPIPSSIGSLTNLKTIVLRKNHLLGPLPPELGLLPNITDFDFSFNFLNGTIPEQIGSLSSLQSLDLCENNLEGIIPAYLGNLSKLKFLNLSYNNLSGEVPMNGILGSFNATSYMGNEFLCGGPLAAFLCHLPGDPMSGDPDGDYMRHRRPYNGGSQQGLSKKIIIAVVVGACGLAVLFVLLAFLSCRARRRDHQENFPNSFSVEVQESTKNGKLVIHIQGFPYNYEEIVSHAGYYDTAHVLGKGRFATVYRSDLPGGKQLAVKVFNNPIPLSSFEREMSHLYESASQVSTLLPIRGYYSNPIENAIFYDFMPIGTLEHVLQDVPYLLDWSKRLSIALGIAQALALLHKGSHSRTLHKDLKSSNVLLDDSLSPLVGDYGLVELVSKALVLTPGYTPPEFLAVSSSSLSSSKRYTEKTDIYSFGVVLMELLTGRGAIDVDIEMPLATWVQGLYKEGNGPEVLNPFVVESCPSIDHPLQVLDLAITCLKEEPTQRPTINEILTILERLTSKS